MGAGGVRVGAHFEGFADYLAAKAFFDQQETVYISVTDGGGATEAEHSVIVIPSRSKSLFDYAAMYSGRWYARSRR
jgi:hypothetical protein